MNPNKSFQFVSIGQVIKTHGTKGRIVVRLENPKSIMLKPFGPIYFGDETSELHRYTIRFIHISGSNARMELAEIDNCDKAALLVHKTVWCSEKDMAPPAPDTYYYYQLRGLKVVTSDGRLVGTLVEIMETGANDVYIVRSGDHEYLIPAIRSVIQSIDLKSGFMVIENIENMLESK